MRVESFFEVINKSWNIYLYQTPKYVWQCFEDCSIQSQKSSNDHIGNVESIEP